MHYMKCYSPAAVKERMYIRVAMTMNPPAPVKSSTLGMNQPLKNHNRNIKPPHTSASARATDSLIANIDMPIVVG